MIAYKATYIHTLYINFCRTCGMWHMYVLQVHARDRPTSAQLLQNAYQQTTTRMYLQSYFNAHICIYDLPLIHLFTRCSLTHSHAGCASHTRWQVRIGPPVQHPTQHSHINIVISLHIPLAAHRRPTYQQ